MRPLLACFFVCCFSGARAAKLRIQRNYFKQPQGPIRNSVATNAKAEKIMERNIREGKHWTATTGKCLDGEQWLADFPKGPDADFRSYSQGDQDGVLRSLFRPENLGTTNRLFVEMGFPDMTLSTSYGNGHELVTGMMFQPILLLDSEYDNPVFNLHKELVSPNNIVDIFKKYNVPKEVDYISIDLDSTDIWIFMAITKEYRPRVMTVEFNSERPLNNTLAMRADAKYSWDHDNLYGASLSALFLAAEKRGYTMVYATRICDVFLIRNDLICTGTEPALSAFESRTNDPFFPKYAGQQGPAEEKLIDFKQWLEDHPDA